MSTAQVKWFLQYRGTVQGPFNNDTLPKALQNLGDDSVGHVLVWRRGLSEWIKSNQWQKADQQIAAAMARTSSSAKPSSPTAPAPASPRPQAKPAAEPAPVAKAPPPIPRPAAPAPRPVNNETATVMNPIDPATQVTVMAGATQQYDDEHTRTVVDNELFEKTFTQAFADGQFYRVQVNFVDQPLMSKNELVQLIAKQEDISAISIQDSKTKEWKEIYAYPDLVEKLGISRRKSLRVPILAQFNGRSSKGFNIASKVITVSEGGMGFTENFELKIGDEIEGQVSSPHFFQPITVKAEVIYAGLDGYIGLKFVNLSDETKSAVYQYIKKFGKSQKS